MWGGEEECSEEDGESVVRKTGCGQKGLLLYVCKARTDVSFNIQTFVVLQFSTTHWCHIRS